MRTALLTLLVLAACGSKTPDPKSATDPLAATPDAGARTCRSSADCGEGELCFGPEGCDVEWTCVPDRPCTRDLAFYCGCDGQSLTGSGSCPPAPYAHRGECPAP